MVLNKFSCCGAQSSSKRPGVKMELLPSAAADQSILLTDKTASADPNTDIADVMPSNLSTTSLSNTGHLGERDIVHTDMSRGPTTADDNHVSLSSVKSDLVTVSNAVKGTAEQGHDGLSIGLSHAPNGESLSHTSSLVCKPSRERKAPPIAPTTVPSRTSSSRATPRGRYNLTVNDERVGRSGPQVTNVNTSVCTSPLIIDHPSKTYQEKKDEMSEILNTSSQLAARDRTNDVCHDPTNPYRDTSTTGVYKDINSMDRCMDTRGPSVNLPHPIAPDTRRASCSDSEHKCDSNDHVYNYNCVSPRTADISHYSGIMPHNSSVLTNDNSITHSGYANYKDNDTINKSTNSIPPHSRLHSRDTSAVVQSTAVNMSRGRAINAPSLYKVYSNNATPNSLKVGGAGSQTSHLDYLSCPPAPYKQHHYTPSYLTKKSPALGRYDNDKRSNSYTTPKRCIAAPSVTETDVLMSKLPNVIDTSSMSSDGTSTNMTNTMTSKAAVSSYPDGPAKVAPQRARVQEPSSNPTPIPPYIVPQLSPAGNRMVSVSDRAPVLISHVTTDTSGVPIDHSLHSVSHNVSLPYGTNTVSSLILQGPPMPKIIGPILSPISTKAVVKETYVMPRGLLHSGADGHDVSPCVRVSISEDYRDCSQEYGNSQMSIVYNNKPMNRNDKTRESSYQTVEVEVEDVYDDIYDNNNNNNNNVINNNNNVNNQYRNDNDNNNDDNKMCYNKNTQSYKDHPYGGASNIEYAYNMSLRPNTNKYVIQEHHKSMEHTPQSKSPLTISMTYTCDVSPLWDNGHKTGDADNSVIASQGLCGPNSLNATDYGRHDHIRESHAIADGHQDWDSSVTYPIPIVTKEVPVTIEHIPPVSTPSVSSPVPSKDIDLQRTASSVSSNQAMCDHNRRKAMVRQAVMSGGIFGGMSTNTSDTVCMASHAPNTSILKKRCSAIAPFVKSTLVSRLSKAHNELRGALRVKDVILILNSYITNGNGNSRSSSTKSNNDISHTGPFTASDIRELLLIAEGGDPRTLVSSSVDESSYLETVVPYASLVSGIIEVNRDNY